MNAIKKKRKLTGKVIDKQKSENLAEVTLMLFADEVDGRVIAKTNAKGEFSFEIPEALSGKSLMIRFSKDNYLAFDACVCEKDTIEVDLKADTPMNRFAVLQDNIEGKGLARDNCRKWNLPKPHTHILKRTK